VVGSSNCSSSLALQTPAALFNRRVRTTLRAFDYRDHVVETFADTEARLLARIADVEAERDVYQDLLRAALSHANDLNVEITRLTQRVARLRDRLRELMGFPVCEAAGHDDDEDGRS